MWDIQAELAAIRCSCKLDKESSLSKQNDTVVVIIGLVDIYKLLFIRPY
jgi:hypothetical protein